MARLRASSAWSSNMKVLIEDARAKRLARARIQRLMIKFKKKIKIIPPGKTGLSDSIVLDDWGYKGGFR